MKIESSIDQVNKVQKENVELKNKLAILQQRYNVQFNRNLMKVELDIDQLELITRVFWIVENENDLIDDFDEYYPEISDLRIYIDDYYSEISDLRKYLEKLIKPLKEKKENEEMKYLN